MATEQTQIDEMRLMCAALNLTEQVDFANVDDWGRFGNFQLVVTPKHHDRHTTQRLSALIKRSLPKGAMFRAIFGPNPIKEYNPFTKTTKVRGYSRSFWIVDIDYHHYDFETNSFGEPS